MKIQKLWTLFLLGLVLAMSALSLDAKAVEAASERWVRGQESKISKIAKDGDIIFQYFTGDLSLAIEEVQKSSWTHVGILFFERDGWYVYEAVGPVIKTPLRDFLRVTNDEMVSISRVKSELVDLTKRSNVSALKRSFKPYEGIDYDFIFQWSDDLIYCSELVYKMYESTFDVQIGDLVKIRELDISGPLAKELIRQRREYLNGDAYLDELIVTPGSQFTDGDLDLIYDSTAPPTETALLN